MVELFKKLYDAHAIYFAPAGYRSFATVRPFTLSSSLVNGTQYIYAEKGIVDSEQYKRFCDCDLDLDKYFGRRILKINSLDVFSFLELESDEVGLYYDKNVRFNELLASHYPFQLKPSFFHTPKDDFEFYQFDGDSKPISFPVLALSYIPIKNKEDIINRNLNVSSHEHNLSCLLNLLASAKKRDKSFESLVNGFIESNDVEHFKSLSPYNQMVRISEGISLYMKSHSQHDPNTDKLQIFDEDDDKNVTFPPGEKTYLVTYREGDGIYHLSYEDTTVLKITSFYPKLSNIEEYMDIARGITRNRMRNGLNKNLIIDVSGNGGGYVCLSYWLLSLLVKDWHNGSYIGDDNLYYPYDFKKSVYTDDLIENGYFDDDVYIDPINKMPYEDDEWYESVSKEYGGSVSNYTQPLYIGHCKDIFDVSKDQWVFDKIIVLTDGRCGSACSYFVTKLRLSDKVRIASYGGIYGEDLSVSQYAGGQVIEWNSFIDELKNKGIEEEWIKPFPTTSISSFNFLQTFTDLNMTIPLQYIKITADFEIPLWKAIYNPSFLDDNGRQYLADLYEATQTFFDQVPSGLPGKNTGLTSLQVLLIVIGVMMGLALILFAVWVSLKRLRYSTF